MILSLLGWTVVAVIATAILWKGSDWLEHSSEGLSTYYELPDIVQGAIVVAVGSSFPELATVVISTVLHGEFELGVAAIVGSAIFNILVIPAAAGLVTKNPLKSNRDLVYKEAQFYIISVAVLIITFSFAAIFNPVASDVAILGEMDRTLALMPIILYGFYIFIQYQETIEFESAVNAEEINPLKEWGLLAASLVVILIGVELLVQAAIHFGDLLGTPSFLWGISVVAAGTSIPPTFAPAPPPPEPGERPFLLRHYAGSAETALLLWVEEYLAPGLCEGLGGGQTLKMGVMAVLYDLPAGTELDRWSAAAWVTGGDPSQERVWRATERLAADLLDRLLPGPRETGRDHPSGGP